MKKTVILFIFLFSGSLLFSGCTNKQDSKMLNVGDLRRPDFGQPERQADIRGLVKSITGNELTILKIERPGMGAGLEDIDEKDSEHKPGSRIPGMGMGSGSRLSGSASDKAAVINRMKDMATGEEAVVIPVGIQMLKANPVDVKSGPIEATLNDIKNDKMVQIWLDESVDNRNIASFVMITR